MWYFTVLSLQGVVTLVKDKVLLGPAYIVVSCNCSLNTALKNSAEWCEWCKCAKCGGKLLPKSAKDFTSGRKFDLPDVNADLILFGGLMGSLFITLSYASGYPYRHVYIVGCIGTTYCVTRFLRNFGY